MPDDFQDIEDEFLKRLEEMKAEELNDTRTDEEKSADDRRRKAAALAAVVSAI